MALRPKLTFRLASTAWLAMAPLCIAKSASAEATARFSDAPSQGSTTTVVDASQSTTPRPPVTANKHSTALAGPSHAELPQANTPQRHGASSATRCARVSFPLAQARRMVERGNFLEALTKYSQVVMLEGRCGTAVLELAKLREALGDFQEAERLYQRACRLRDSAPEALRRRAVLRRRQGRTRDAFEDLRAAQELEPAHLSTLRTLADWYVEARAWAAALAQYRAIVRVLAQQRDNAGLEVAKTKARALAALAAETDPVSNGKHADSWVRRSLSQLPP